MEYKLGRGKGATHETGQKSKGVVNTRNKSSYKKRTNQAGSHIKGGPIDEIGMPPTKKSIKLTHLATTLEVKNKVHDTLKNN